MSRYVKKDVPFELAEIDIKDADDKQLIKISNEMGIGLNLTEIRLVQDYFSRKKRNPTDVELQTIGQTWSEHCYHKTFKGNITTPEGTIRSLFKTYIAKATKELNPEWCISVFEDNAGIIEFDGNYAIAAKVETHNHPSAIEPFGGAATGTTGAVSSLSSRRGGLTAYPTPCFARTSLIISVSGTHTSESSPRKDSQAS